MLIDYSNVSMAPVSTLHYLIALAETILSELRGLLAKADPMRMHPLESFLREIIRKLEPYIDCYKGWCRASNLAAITAAGNNVNATFLLPFPGAITYKFDEIDSKLVELISGAWGALAVAAFQDVLALCSAIIDVRSRGDTPREDYVIKIYSALLKITRSPISDLVTLEFAEYINLYLGNNPDKVIVFWVPADNTEEIQHNHCPFKPLPGSPAVVSVRAEFSGGAVKTTVIGACGYSAEDMVEHARSLVENNPKDVDCTHTFVFCSYEYL